MAKNLVNRVRDFDQYEDLLALENKRAKIVTVSKKQELGDIRWARTNKVDDESIVAVFGSDTHLLDLLYRERFRVIVVEAAKLGHTVRADA
jgi:hypothetical protein